MKSKLLLLNIILLMVVSACRVEPPVVPAGFTIEDEVKLGAIIHQQLVDDEAIHILDPSEHKDAYNYISGIRAFILSGYDLENKYNYDWQIHIIYDDGEQTEDIFTTVGGHIYINTTMLNYIQNENQLLNLLAHEMAYADNQIMRGILEEHFNFSMILDVIRGGSNSIAKDMKNIILNANYPPMIVENMDAFTVEIVCPTPYNADGLAEFLTWLGNEPLRWHTRHPSLNLVNRAINISMLKMDYNCEGDFIRESTYQGFLTLLP